MFQKSDILNEQNLLCQTCCIKLTNLYEFRDLCKKNKEIFEGYVVKLKQGIVKQGNLTINLEKLNIDDKTVPKINKTGASDSFLFDLSSADEFKPEYCVRVENTEMCVDPVVSTGTQELNSSIEDLSRSEVVVLDLAYENSNETSNQEPLLENTDGEIKIERGKCFFYY